MQVMLLGTAAGGGFPQWNCWCPTCRVARDEPARAHPRSQSSIAFSADGARWFLANASPDVREQLTRLPRPALTDAAPSTRRVPIEGILLTDAELDHSLGIALLREGRHLPLLATSAVLGILERDSRLLPVTRAFAQLDVTTLPLDEDVELAYRDQTQSGLVVRAFAVTGDPPRFARDDEPGHTVGLEITDRSGPARCTFLPGCATLDAALLGRLGRADLLLFDGTFWSEDELIALGISDRTASEIGHAPVAGPVGTLPRLVALPTRRKVYTHINNTNPMLLEGSVERQAVERAGLVVGDDGMCFSL